MLTTLTLDNRPKFTQVKLKAAALMVAISVFGALHASTVHAQQTEMSDVEVVPLGTASKKDIHASVLEQAAIEMDNRAMAFEAYANVVSKEASAVKACGGKAPCLISVLYASADARKNYGQFMIEHGQKYKAIASGFNALVAAADDRAKSLYMDYSYKRDEFFESHDSALNLLMANNVMSEEDAQSLLTTEQYAALVTLAIELDIQAYDLLATMQEIEIAGVEAQTYAANISAYQSYAIDAKIEGTQLAGEGYKQGRNADVLVAKENGRIINENLDSFAAVMSDKALSTGQSAYLQEVEIGPFEGGSADPGPSYGSGGLGLFFGNSSAIDKIRNFTLANDAVSNEE